LNGQGGKRGKAKLYVPYMFAFIVFSAVIGAEYLIVQTLIGQCEQRETDKYHGTLSLIIDYINRYEFETGKSILLETASIEFILESTGIESLEAQIIPDSAGYNQFISSGSADAPVPASGEFENTIIETSKGKTANGEIVILEVHEYKDTQIKILENTSKSLIIIAITMIIFSMIPGSLIIDSLTRRSSMMSFLAPVSSRSSSDVINAGIENSKALAFLIVSPEGSVISASRECLKLLEIGTTSAGMSLSSLVALPSEVRKIKPSLVGNTAAKIISIKSMNGSGKDCVMEIHPFYREGSLQAVLYLFIPGMNTEEIISTDTGGVNTDRNRDSSRAKNHLLQSLVHDMNNHLCGIIGIASVELGRLDSPVVRGSFKAVLDSAEIVTSLCNELKDTVSGSDDSKLRDPSREIGLIADVLRRILPDRVDIEVTGACNTWINTGRELLRELFYSLALNSTGMMNGEGRIRIDVSDKMPLAGSTIETISPDSKVCIRYSDGFIMPVVLRDILSNRKYSLPDIERQYGSNIGKAYKALNDLSVSVVFERGSGETVLCLLINGIETTDTKDKATKLFTRDEDIRGFSVLVADEVEIVLHSTSEYLEHRGMVTTRAKDGDQVMELLRKNHYDAAVLDMNMSGVSTPRIVRFCQTSRPDMAIVISTGFDATQVVRDLIKFPSTDYLHKPHRPEVLVDMIHSIRRRLKEGSIT
jgi:CheY-like chemotaxis protein